MSFARLVNWNQFGILFGLAAMVALFAALEPIYVSPGNLITVLEQASITAILTIGVTFIIITAGIDLSFGAVLGLCAALAGVTVAGSGNVTLALGAAILAGGACGLINGALITGFGVTPLIATLGTMSVFSGIALILTGGRTLFGLPVIYTDSIGGRFMGAPVVLYVFLLVLCASWFALNRTKFGQYCVAIGGGPESARMAGVNVAGYTVSAYVMMGALAGLCGALTVGRLNSADPQVGADLLLPVIAAAILGGAKLAGGSGSVVGAALGAIFISALQAGLTILLIPAFYQRLAVGGAIILAVAFQSYKDGGWTILTQLRKGARER